MRSAVTMCKACRSERLTWRRTYGEPEQMCLQCGKCQANLDMFEDQRVIEGNRKLARWNRAVGGAKRSKIIRVDWKAASNE